jgi:hypothetical protein
VKNLFLLTIFFSSLSLAQFQGFQTTFTFSELSIHTQDLVLGYDPFGTDGLDSNLGETIVPQVPPGSFGVRFQLPSDTSIYTLKDIRFGCGQPFYYEYLVDLSYDIGVIDIDWEWDWQFWMIDFINPYNGQTIASFEAYFDSSFYEFLTLDKIIMGIHYNGPLSWPSYELTSPLSGEVIEGGQNFLITWSASLAQWSDIEFSSNNGISWEYVAQNIPAPQNSYNWNVPNINSEHCLLRIGEYPCAYDISDGTFVIYENYPPVLNAVEIPFWLINSIGDTLHLIAGMHPMATNGLDTTLGEESIQFPPIGNFAAGMIINSSILSMKDYRPGYSTYIGSKTYNFKVQPNIDSLVTFGMNVPEGVIPSLIMLIKIPYGYSGLDTTFLSNNIIFQFPQGTVYGGWGTFPGIRLYLNFDGTIPVELINFSSTIVENNIHLNWTTATETNNMGFEIHKKKSGVRSQESEWKYIGFVPGHGTTTETQFYSFTDESLQPGEYHYRLKQIDFDGSFEYSKIVEVTIEAPTKFSLSQNYPNPFNSSTTIAYGLPEATYVSLIIYDCLGNNVRTLVNEVQEAGAHYVVFESNNLSSGIYFMRIRASNWDETKRIIILK